MLPRRTPRRPGPLEIKTAQMPGNIDNLANKKQAGLGFCFEGFGGEAIAVDAAEGDFGGAIAFGAGGEDFPLLKLFCNVLDFFRQVLVDRAIAVPLVAP